MPDPTPSPSRRRCWTTALDGPRLRQLRRQRGLSQEQLADQAGLSLTTVTQLERQIPAACPGRTLARLATWRRAAALLDGAVFCGARSGEAGSSAAVRIGGSAGHGPR